jgi:chorismate mutase
MSHPDKAKSGAAPTLADLRAEIDRIDASMHALLIERGEIIGELIKVKRTQESGAAFRPAREASMMRKLVERHRGILPLDTVESIWRVIIATFTFVQAPYAVHADFSSGDAPVRDSARFHFGFTVPLSAHLGAAPVVAAVARSKGDLGLVPAINVAAAGAWWTALEDEAAPKIIARLPFVEREDHPASLPLFVLSRPIAPDGGCDRGADLEYSRGRLESRGGESDLAARRRDRRARSRARRRGDPVLAAARPRVRGSARDADRRGRVCARDGPRRRARDPLYRHVLKRLPLPSPDHSNECARTTVAATEHP